MLSSWIHFMIPGLQYTVIPSFGWFWCLFQLLTVFNAAELVAILQRVLEQKEVNWQHVLTCVATAVVCQADAASHFQGMFCLLYAPCTDSNKVTVIGFASENHTMNNWSFFHRSLIVCLLLIHTNDWLLPSMVPDQHASSGFQAFSPNLYLYFIT